MVMIVGAGFSFDWGLVQTEVAGFTRVCTYDAAGTAWSDPGPGPGCQSRVDEIRRVLRADNVRGPYVLAGLSIGALTARLFAAEYPSEVAGIAFMDHAFIDLGIPPPRPVETGPDRNPVLLQMTPIVISVEDDPAFQRLPESIRQRHRWAAGLLPELATVGTAQDCLAAVAAGTQARPQPLGNIPLRVVSTTNDSHNYDKLQQELLSLSANSKQIIAEKSIHSIEISEPEVAARAIREVVEAVRSAIIR